MRRRSWRTKSANRIYICGADPGAQPGDDKIFRTGTFFGPWARSLVTCPFL